MTTSVSSKGQRFYFLILYNPWIFFSFLFYCYLEWRECFTKTFEYNWHFRANHLRQRITKRSVHDRLLFYKSQVCSKANERVYQDNQDDRYHSFPNELVLQRHRMSCICFCRSFSYSTSDIFEIRCCLHSRRVCD